MLARGPDLLRHALAEGRAVPAFTTYTLESTRAVCAAAERTGLPVILSAGSSSFRGAGRAPLAAAALAAAHEASVPVGVHLDHSTDLEEIAACIELGYTSVMYDGSSLPFEDNVAATAAVVERAHAAGAWVEAELGGVAGGEDASSDAEAVAVTDAEEAVAFAGRTGVDALACAVGTVHGFTSRPVHVDVGLVREIARRTGIPLVLHGASGLPDAQLTAAVEAGIAKVNVNAELRRAHLGALREGLDAAGDDLPALQAAAVAAMQAVAEDKLALLAGRGAPAGAGR
jgi:ketose-bisphosphate aldolase